MERRLHELMQSVANVRIGADLIRRQVRRDPLDLDRVVYLLDRITQETGRMADTIGMLRNSQSGTEEGRHDDGQGML